MFTYKGLQTLMLVNIQGTSNFNVGLQYKPGSSKFNVGLSKFNIHLHTRVLKLSVIFTQEPPSLMFIYTKWSFKFIVGFKVQCQFSQFNVYQQRPSDFNI